MPLVSWLNSATSAVRRESGAAFFGLVMLTASMPAFAQMPGSNLPDLIQQLMPSVVNITSRSLVANPGAHLNAATPPQASSGMTPEQRSKTELGSGFVIDSDGIILTNNHVIEGAFDVSVTFQDGAVAHATVMATTKVGDIALLKVNVGHKLPALRFGDSTLLRVGDPVVAIGNPLGFGGSVSTGIVSALNRDIMISPFDDFIQTDAALNHGNSGGPLFNRNGEVIGVNTALYTPTSDGGSIGIGFALPSYGVQFVVGELEKYGVVRPGEVGLKGQDVTADIAHGADLPPTSRTNGILPGSAGWGVIVTEVLPNGPAAAAGIQEGDILLKIDGVQIADVRALARMVAIHPLDEKVTFSIWRYGDVTTATPIVREWVTSENNDRIALANSTSQRVHSMDLGLQLEGLNDDLRSAHNISLDQNGVLITKVVPDSIAGDRGLNAGDVITKVMSTPVTQPADVFANLKTLLDAHRTMALLLVHSGSGLRWVPIPINDGVQAAIAPHQD